MTHLFIYLLSRLNSQLSAEMKVYWDMNYYHKA